ncbi:MFS transporter [Bifidobacterium samirii]|uniref:Major Facilitator Superfamily n=1 Tax=Bifidobacterium samirii TaxID=2306974 RepID=A0A430FW59_9BIFI|nr:MFS transporter [Bifidobacterium samirii]RSX58355.1 Major Facilitator Superfamily [Bifidobacterium samirii]
MTASSTSSAPSSSSIQSTTQSADADTPTAARASLWRNGRYRAWFAADTASAVGAAMKGFAISLTAFALSGSLPAAGWLGTAAVIVSQVAQTVGGTLVDRHERRRLVIVNALCGVVLWGAAAALMTAGLITFPLFAAIALAASTVNGLLGNATDAMLRSLLPIEDYPRAQALNQGRDSVVALAGSPLGGMLYAVAAWMPFAAASLLYAVSGAAAIRMQRDDPRRAGLPDSRPTASCDRAPSGAPDSGTPDSGTPTDEEAPAPTAARTSFLADFLDGWRWTLRRRTLMLMCVIVALLNFGVNGVLATIELQLVGDGVVPVRIGFVSTAIGGGMLAGAALAGLIADRVPVGRGLIVTSALCLAALAPMMATHAYPAILASTIALALPMPTMNALLVGFVFAKVPADMQGRVGSASDLLSMLPTLFCSAIVGSLLPAVGFRTTTGVFLAALACNLAIVLADRSVRRIPAADRWPQVDL